MVKKWFLMMVKKWLEMMVKKWAMNDGGKMVDNDGEKMVIMMVIQWLMSVVKMVNFDGETMGRV